jgi:hypothetical protein
MSTETKRKFKALAIAAFMVGIFFVPVSQAQAALAPECSKDDRLAPLYNASGLTKERREELYNENACQFSDLIGSAAQLINYLVSFIGIFVVFMLVFRGAQMVVNAGNEAGVKAAKSGMSNAIIGLLLVLFSYIVINTLFDVFGVEEAFNFTNNPFEQNE